MAIPVHTDRYPEGGAVEGLATTSEVAAYLNVRPHTLANWAAQKKGPPFIKVEGARRYDMTDVRAWLEERKVRH